MSQTIRGIVHDKSRYQSTYSILLKIDRGPYRWFSIDARLLRGLMDAKESGSIVDVNVEDGAIVGWRYVTHDCNAGDWPCNDVPNVERTDEEWINADGKEHTRRCPPSW